MNNNLNDENKRIVPAETNISEDELVERLNAPPEKPRRLRGRRLIPILVVILLVTIANNFVISRFDHFGGLRNFLPTSAGQHRTNVDPVPIPADGIRASLPITLTADLVNARIVIEPHNANDIFITYDSPRRGQFVPPRYSLNGTTLDITQESPNFNFGASSNSGGVITIFVPQDTNNVFDLLQLSTISGGISIDGNTGVYLADNLLVSSTSGEITANNFSVMDNLDFSVISGRIRASNLSAHRDFTARSTSGRVNVEYIVAETVTASSTSGATSASYVTADQITVRSTSGRVRMDNLQTDNLVAGSTSSGVQLQDSQITGEITLSAVSGRITLNNVDANPNLMNLSTVSGRITVDGNRWHN
ncbi:MAG: DUF4097 domain-containing protein [Firmicutes bacterium]|nr:DUF4097 domain-containing protein [Bacillota bacterium]